MKSNANAGAAANRRSRWKAAKTSTARPRSQFAARIGWSLASAALLVALGFLVVPPLFVWHAAVVWLSVDEHALGMLAPLPFAAEDAAAIDASLAGMLSPAVGDRPRHPLVLAQFDTAAALGDPLREKMANLRLGARDVLVALVRGQTVVAADGAGATRTWLIPEDAKGARGLTAEFVPCRDLVSAFTATPARTTLVALDMGDLCWDPRLGVVGGLVPAHLDQECREPLPSLGDERTCWILGSHDAHEFSGVSLGGRRSFFSRSIELGLSGLADDPRFGSAGGDGDGVVELDELARFTAAWTSAWARRESNGEFDQRPVLWRVGSGRVPLTDVPRGIPIIRVGRSPPARLPTALIRAAADGPAPSKAEPPVVPSTGGPPGVAVPAAAPAGPPAASAPPAPVTVWELLDRAAALPFAEAPAAVDYAPHLWRETLALAAAAVSTPRDRTPLARLAADVEKRLVTGLERFLAGSEQVNDADDPLRRLFEARRAAATAGLPAVWSSLPADVRSAIAVRNRGLPLATAAAAWVGAGSGSSLVGPLERPMRTLIDKLQALDAELTPLAQGAREETAGFDRLVQRRQAAETAAAALRREVDAVVDQLIGRIDRGQDRLPTADLRWLLTSPLPNAAQRSRIASALAAKQQTGKEQTGKDEPGRDQSAADKSVEETGPRQASDIGRWLPQEIAGVAPPVEPRKPPDGVWRQVGDRIGVARQVLQVLGRGRDSGDAALEAAVADLARDGDAAVRLEAAVRAGGVLADRLARIPEEIDAALRGRGASPLRTSVVDQAHLVDALLRSCDPRDAARVRGDALGWVPKVRTAAPLDLAITTPDRQVETSSDRRVTVALASGAAFPAAGTLTLEFDPAALRVRAVGGDVIEPGRGIRREQLTGSDRLLLDVSARRRAAGPDRDRAAVLKGVLALGTRRGEGELPLQLPIIEQLVVAVRGQPGTVEEGAEQPDRWRRIAIDPLASGQEAAAAEKGSAPPWGLVRLRPFPGHVTGWEMAVFNKSGGPRRVAVDLVTLAPPAPLTADAGRPAEPTGRREDEAFALLASTLAKRLPLPPGTRLVSSIQDLELPDSDQRIDIFLPGPKPPAAPATGQPGTGQAAALKPEPLGATLALVIRDLVAGQEPGNAKEGAPQARGVPREKARVWLVRLPLVPQHPRRYVDAVGTWQRDDRSVTIDVRPRGGDAALLPRGGAKLAAAPLVSGGVRSQPVDMKIVAGLVSAAQPRGVLRAQWNGVDDDAAWLSVDVDGHPRARVFRVQCGAADVGVEQRPQEDWRQVEIVAPAADLQPFKAPANRIPLSVAVDGPPDAFGGGGGVVELSVREVRNLAGGIPDTGRVVWAVDSDRQVAFTHEEPTPPAAIAVSTVVSDWRIELADLGFQDVDVIAEARLKLPGDAAVRTASRTLVLDASPPRVAVLPRLKAEKGKPATLAIRPEDGLESSPAVGGRRSGASGIDRVEWAVDAKLTGAPEKWEPAAAGADGEYRADVATDNLQIGRYRLVVRAFDRVGLESRPAFSELEVVMPVPVAKPGETAVDNRNAIVGRVTLGGRPQAGVSVTIDGPGGPPPATSGPDGSFTVGGLEPGEYRVSVPETTVKNRLYKAAPQPVVVAPSPAKPATVTVQLE